MKGLRYRYIQNVKNILLHSQMGTRDGDKSMYRINKEKERKTEVERQSDRARDRIIQRKKERQEEQK